MNTAFSQYKQQNIMNLTKGEQLILLYDEIIKELNLSKFYISNNDFCQCNETFHRAHKINNYLISILNNDYEISENLLQLYMFCRRQITTANTLKDIKMVDEVLAIYVELRDAFQQAQKSK